MSEDGSRFGAESQPPATHLPNTIRRPTLAKTSAFHSVKAFVHHNNTSCNTGNNIEAENRRSGTGGKPLCAECNRL